MKGHWIEYTRTELAFIKRRTRMNRRELHAVFVKTFSRHDVSFTHLNALCKRNGWFTGRTGCFKKGTTPHNKGKPHPAARSGNAAKHHFKKGNLPHNTNYLGHERVSKDGYTEISIDEPNPYTGFERRYVLKHRWLWEAQHGPIPKGMCLKCLGEQTDTAPANWELVPRALLPRLNGRFGRGYDDAPNELKPTIMAVVKVEHQLREKQRRRTPALSPALRSTPPADGNRT
jgi:hypothetical protein